MIRLHGSRSGFTSLVTVLWLASPAALVGQDPGVERIRPGDIVVANLGDHSVSVFDGESGAFRGPAFAPGAGGLQNATGIAFGPDGALYVGSSGNGRILRYDGATGAFIDVFASGAPLERPYSLIFGPGGDLFVSSGPAVLRYSANGSFVRYAARDSTLEQPIGLAVGADGFLYVVSSTAPSVLRFDPDTGTSAGTFVTDSLAFPSDVAFGPDGDLYVSNASSSRVVRFNGASGAFEAVVATLPERGVPMGLAFRGRRLVIGDFGQSRLYFVDIDDPAAGPTEVARQGLLRPENVAVRPGGEAPDSGIWPTVPLGASGDRPCRRPDMRREREAPDGRGGPLPHIEPARLAPTLRCRCDLRWGVGHERASPTASRERTEHTWYITHASSRAGKGLAHPRSLGDPALPARGGGVRRGTDGARRRVGPCGGAEPAGRGEGRFRGYRARPLCVSLHPTLPLRWRVGQPLSGRARRCGRGGVGRLHRGLPGSRRIRPILLHRGVLRPGGAGDRRSRGPIGGELSSRLRQSHGDSHRSRRRRGFG